MYISLQELTKGYKPYKQCTEHKACFCEACGKPQGMYWCEECNYNLTTGICEGCLTLPVKDVEQ